MSCEKCGGEVVLGPSTDIHAYTGLWLDFQLCELCSLRIMARWMPHIPRTGNPKKLQKAICGNAINEVDFMEGLLVLVLIFEQGYNEGHYRKPPPAVWAENIQRELRRLWGVRELVH
jgi:hypothetical protein